MMSQQEPAQLNRLDLSKQIKLADLMRADYTASGMTDPAYAVHATEKLGFQVTAANVYNMRNSIGIESNNPRRRVSTDPDLESRIDALEAAVARLVEHRVGALEASVARLVQQLGGLQ